MQQLVRLLGDSPDGRRHAAPSSGATSAAATGLSSRGRRPQRRRRRRLTAAAAAARVRRSACSTSSGLSRSRSTVRAAVHQLRQREAARLLLAARLRRRARGVALASVLGGADRQPSVHRADRGAAERHPPPPRPPVPRAAGERAVVLHGREFEAPRLELLPRAKLSACSHDQSTGFIVRHYAGDITYSGGAFLELNNDTLTSTRWCSYIAHLFTAPSCSRQGSASVAARRSRRWAPSSPPTSLSCSRRSHAHFVRCMKPNLQMAPLFDSRVREEPRARQGSLSALKFMRKLQGGGEKLSTLMRLRQKKERSISYPPRSQGDRARRLR